MFKILIFFSPDIAPARKRKRNDVDGEKAKRKSTRKQKAGCDEDPISDGEIEEYLRTPQEIATLKPIFDKLMEEADVERAVRKLNRKKK